MADKAISNLYSDHPVTAPDDTALFEIGGDFSGAISFADLKTAVAPDLSSPPPIGDVAQDTIRGTAVSGNDSVKSFGYFDGNNRWRLYGGNSDGRLWLTNSQAADFDLLQFGKTDATRPALKVNAAGLEARLADDSDYTTFRASAFTGNGSGLTSVPGALTIDSGWLADGNVGDKTAVIPDNVTTQLSGEGFTTAFPNTSSIITAISDKLKALHTALVALKTPNA